MKFFKIITMLLPLISCSSAAVSSNSGPPCDQFKAYVNKQDLRNHDGMCLIKNGNVEGKYQLMENMKFVFPVLDQKGRPCAAKKDNCPVFIVMSWNSKASVGVLVTEDVLKNGGFDGEDIEPTLSYIREKTGIKFRRKN